MSKSNFLFNPENPKTSFDVYKDKNPSDTIPIKYTTLADVKDTIRLLESLYKNGEYPHKRISQVAMVMMVRLRVLEETKQKQYLLAERYFEFLKDRTKMKEEDRFKSKFKF